MKLRHRFAVKMKRRPHLRPLGSGRSCVIEHGEWARMILNLQFSDDGFLYPEEMVKASWKSLVAAGLT